MKYLIVNGDDFGASRGINRGIMEAHERGILTSASLMVDGPASEEAAELSGRAPNLSVGLHIGLREDLSELTAGRRRLREELRRQFGRFEELMGRTPTHLDSHHNVHRDPRALPDFLHLAHQHGLPLRQHSPVRSFAKFYGQWDGKPHPEQITVGNLVQMLTTEIDEGVTELSCHPGYMDREFSTSYSAEREVELHTLCDPHVRPTLAAHAIQLTNYHRLGPLLLGVPA
jgi:predicted glycoside hydrolase/deacetylase ChbG (UPF0249 family)